MSCSQAAVIEGEEQGSRHHPCHRTKNIFWHSHLTNISCLPITKWLWLDSTLTQQTPSLTHPVEFSEHSCFSRTVHQPLFSTILSSTICYFLFLSSSLLTLPQIYICTHSHAHSSISQPYRWNATIWLISRPAIISSPSQLKDLSFTPFSSFCSSVQMENHLLFLEKY